MPPDGGWHSNAKTARPGLDRAIETFRAGDTLVVWRLDRLWRSLPHLISPVGGLQQRDAGSRSLQAATEHHRPDRQPGLPHLRRHRRVRAEPDPGADAGGAGRGRGGRVGEGRGRRGSGGVAGGPTIHPAVLGVRAAAGLDHVPL
jgi:hypothetical protein